MSADGAVRRFLAAVPRAVATALAAARERLARARSRHGTDRDATPLGAEDDAGAVEGGWSLDLPDDREEPAS